MTLIFWIYCFYFLLLTLFIYLYLKLASKQSKLQQEKPQRSDQSVSHRSNNASEKHSRETSGGS